MSDIIYPSYYRIFVCREGRWFVKNTDLFYSPHTHGVNRDDLTALFGMSEQEVVIELFRLWAGKSGYYLANLRDERYYFCGQTRADLKTKFVSLGIGRADPLEKT